MQSARGALGLALVMFLAGCQSRLDHEQSYRLGTGDAKAFEIEPPRYDQKVTVAVDTDAPVSVFVYRKGDAGAVTKDLTLRERSDKALGSWTGEKVGTFEVTIPAKQATIVRVEAGIKPANVKIKVVGK
jgi:hypothetical protein